MPLHCPLRKFSYDACVGCRHNENSVCWANAPNIESLVDILTLEERVAILEGSGVVRKTIYTKVPRNDNDFFKLKRAVEILEFKVDRLQEALKKKTGDNFLYDKVAT